MLSLTKKEVRVATLILDKSYFRMRKIISIKKGHYMMIKWSMLGKDITTPNTCTPNNGMTECVREKSIELKGEINNSTIMVEDFSIVHRQLIRQVEAYQ